MGPCFERPSLAGAAPDALNSSLSWKTTPALGWLLISSTARRLSTERPDPESVIRPLVTRTKTRWSSTRRTTTPGSEAQTASDNYPALSNLGGELMPADLFSNGSTPAIKPDDAEIPKH